MKLTFYPLDKNNLDDVQRIAKWYFDEWGIPQDKTCPDLLTYPNKNVLSQVMMTLDGIPIGSGGIYNKVGIQQKVEALADIKPWLALMYTVPKYRGQGFGQKLLQHLEAAATDKDIRALNLFTFSAERLYSRNDWTLTHRLQLGEKNIAIMKKSLS